MCIRDRGSQSCRTGGSGIFARTQIRPSGMRATSRNLCRTGDIGVNGTSLQPGFTPVWVYSGSFSMSILPQTWFSHGFLPVQRHWIPLTRIQAIWLMKQSVSCSTADSELQWTQYPAGNSISPRSHHIPVMIRKASRLTLPNRCSLAACCEQPL